MSALISFLGGSAFRMVWGEVSSYFNKRQDHQHEMERMKAQENTEKEGQNGVRFEDSPADNRVRLYFPGKPDAATIADLKKSGFRWTPSLGCWQAYRTAMHNARRIAGVHT